jgi:hypothetical protein
MSQRYAVYWTPEPHHPLWHAGCTWLGREATGRVAGPPPPGRTAPWRYGFHATLKPPMRLAQGVDASLLHAELNVLARAVRRFALPPLKVQTLSDFVALRPAQTPEALQALADRCVVQLDRFRQPSDDPEMARRLQGLDDEQRRLLHRWGYPHVLHRWRFHLTLSDALAEPHQLEEVRHEAEAWFAPALALPLHVESVALFEEAGPGLALDCIARFALTL